MAYRSVLFEQLDLNVAEKIKDVVKDRMKKRFPRNEEELDALFNYTYLELRLEKDGEGRVQEIKLIITRIIPLDSNLQSLLETFFPHKKYSGAKRIVVLQCWVGQEVNELLAASEDANPTGYRSNLSTRRM